MKSGNKEPAKSIMVEKWLWKILKRMKDDGDFKNMTELIDHIRTSYDQENEE